MSRKDDDDISLDDSDDGNSTDSDESADYQQVLRDDLGLEAPEGVYISLQQPPGDSSDAPSLFLEVASASSERYFRVGQETLYRDGETKLKFSSLDIGAIIDTYRRESHPRPRNQAATAWIMYLLRSGGLEELLEWYVPSPTLVKLFGVLVGAILLLLANNDIANDFGGFFLAIFIVLWGMGLYQRIHCGEPDAATYFNQYVVPAHKRERQRIGELLPGRNNLRPSAALSCFSLMFGGGILLAMPDRFILSPRTNLGMSVSMIVLGFIGFCVLLYYSLPRRQHHGQLLTVASQPIVFLPRSLELKNGSNPGARPLSPIGSLGEGQFEEEDEAPYHLEEEDDGGRHSPT